MKPRGSRSSATRSEQWRRCADRVRTVVAALSAHGFAAISAAIPAHRFRRPRPPTHVAIRGAPHRRASPFLLLPLPPHPSSPCRSPSPPLHPMPMRNRHCFPQATGHRVARAPPSSLSETVSKTQLQAWTGRSDRPPRPPSPPRPPPELTVAPRPLSRHPWLLLYSTTIFPHRSICAAMEPRRSSEPYHLFRRQTGPPPCRLALQPLHCHPTVAGRPDFIGKSPVPMGEDLPCFVSGQKAEMGRASPI
jgi:hypothetical protein